MQVGSQGKLVRILEDPAHTGQFGHKTDPEDKRTAEELRGAFVTQGNWFHVYVHWNNTVK